MESQVLLESPVRLENLDHQVSLVRLDLREIWEPLDPKEVQVCKDLEETLANLEILVNLEKWVHLAKMVLTERREVPDHLAALGHPDFLDHEANLD